MKIINIPQNTEEWQEFRLGKSGGSGLGKLYPASKPNKTELVEYCKANGIEYTKPAPTKKDIDKRSDMTIDEILEQLTSEQLGEMKAQGDKKDAYYKLVAERVARPITPNDYEDRLDGQKFSMMVRGHILEQEAVEEFEKRNSVKVHTDSVIWQRDDNESSIVSPDAVIGDTRAVEVKAFDTHRIIRAYDENTYPAECHEQIVKYFIVNEKLETLHFVMYTDVMPSLPYLQFDITREDVADDITELTAFEDAILKQVDELAERLAF